MTEDTGELRRGVVVVGASAGGVEALTTVIGALPRELAAAVFVILHLAPTGHSVLAAILDRSGSMPVSVAQDGERFVQGHAYVCPPDFHMLVTDEEVKLTRGPRENGHRPAVDPLFRSAARAWGRCAVGVVLSGTLDDGTAGLAFIKSRGGATVVQDPADAMYSGMPASAIAHVEVDRVVPADLVSDAICELVAAPLGPAVSGHQDNDPARERADEDLVTQMPDESEYDDGRPTSLTCPDCGGVLNLYENGRLMRFGCQVGHTYSPDSLFDGQSQAVESAVWAAIRALEERADLLRRMARRSHQERSARRLQDRASQVEEESRVLHAVAGRIGRASPDTELIEGSEEAAG